MKKLYKITALALLTGLFSHSAKADTLPPDTTNQKKSPSTTLNFFPENMTNAPTASENSAPFSQPRKILNVGDSRTVGMFFSDNKQKYSNTIDCADKNGNLWFAKVGQGLQWFNNSLNQIKSRAADCDVIVINLGVNDLVGAAESQKVAENYLKSINTLAKTWKQQGKEVFFSSSNPVGPQFRGARVFNQKIDNFNRYMQEGLSADVTFIDTNTYIKNKLNRNNCDAAGVHYSATINRDIHQYIESQIERTLAGRDRTQNNLLSSTGKNEILR